MKGVDLFCASPASTAICTGSDIHRPVIRHSGRSSVDRRAPHHRHHHHLPRRPHQPNVPCSSQLMPIIPRTYFEKSRSSSSAVSSSDASKQTVGQRRKSSADIHDLASPIGSARYLLSDVPFVDLVPEPDRLSALVPAEPLSLKARHLVSSSDSPAISSCRSARSRDQVVVLRVNLHCKGCESKLKKHLAKMEGVTSFSIDMEIKKVTIRGDVTPLGVLSSVSRVKYAQLWPASSTSSSPSPAWSA